MLILVRGVYPSTPFNAEQPCIDGDSAVTGLVFAFAPLCPHPKPPPSPRGAAPAQIILLL